MATTRARSSVSLLSWRTALLFLLPLGCIVLYARDPADGGIYPPCPFRAITGLDCPGCGTGRALHQVLHGRIDDAFVLNPLTIAMLPVLAVALVSFAWTQLGWRQPLRLRTPSWAGWALVALVLAFWVVRNLPWAPVAWMASYR